MTAIINGRKIRDDILAEVKEGIEKLPFTPVFCDVLVGDDPASVQYVNMKAKLAESVGMHFHHAKFSKDISTDDLIEEIEKLNSVPNMCGLIVQLPLPPSLDKDKVLNKIAPSIDVDCLGKDASDRFYNGDISVGYPTAIACMAIIDSLNLDLSGKNIVVFGQGMLVGKPVAHLLRARGLEVSVINRKVENKNELIKNADILISATGQGKYITGPMIKNGCVIIDAGTSESAGGIVGDVDLDSVMGIAGYISPVPGGVGPVTVAMLLKNVLAAANKLKS
ncbi:MAG TPA: bifunctional 5,10-methylenetetrahydrofolate dehydrogenase/5,10-methenyltetrahydrofolate cyclohydrolase [Candidatus Paceibacterota bacterium]|nr:bifunctional 5,10-methylenetetrahydrofolate dehydrogenase/5,10-methenyltetrahydrofolate cyclohydrolase [Candidatus Paceibacterota bacterium]